MSIEFWLTTLVVVITPGTGVLYTMAAGLSRGSRASVIAAGGCTLGIVPHMLAAITGLAALMHTSAVAFQVLKYLGVAYLLYMAWGAFRDGGMLTVREDSTPRTPLQVITSGILVNMLNPKLTIFFFAFLPQFVPASAPNGLLRMVGLSAAFMATTFVVFVGYGKCASLIRSKVIARPRILTRIRRSIGVAFVGLAARLALER